MTQQLNTLAEIQRLCIWRKGTKIKHVEHESLKRQGWKMVADNGEGFYIYTSKYENNDWYLILDNDTQSIYEYRKQNYHDKR